MAKKEKTIKRKPLSRQIWKSSIMSRWVGGDSMEKLKAIRVGTKKVKAIWVGTENEPVKIWENGVVLDIELFEQFAELMKEMLQNG